MADEQKWEQWRDANAEIQKPYGGSVHKHIRWHEGVDRRKAFLDGLESGRKELEQWKQEWQDAQIKANEEGFTRTTIQIKYKELEKENAEQKIRIQELESDLESEAKAVGELEEQVEALEEELQVLRYNLKCRDDELAELRAQNEKMKCCGNCTHHEWPPTKKSLKFCLDCKQLDEAKENFILPKWELKNV